MSEMRRQPLKRPPRSSKVSAGVSRLLDEAGAHHAAGRLDAAAAAYGRAERADPSDFRAAYSLASIDMAHNRPDLALPRLKRVIARRPDLFEAQHNLGAASQALERWEEAAAAFERALALRSDAIETRRQLAVALAVLGRVDAALAHHQVLAAYRSTRLWALIRIALLRPSAIDASALGEMRSAAADAGVDVDTRTGLWFALGETLEAQGLDDDAFAAFSEGNRMRREALSKAGTAPGALLAAHAEAIGRIERRFTPEFLASQAGGGLAEPRPIFVVGMPRSGSTLIEQILASHPHVQTLGETGELPRLLETGAFLDEAAPDARDLARQHLRALRGRGWREPARPVDKTLENYLHVGAIALMFPRAVILHAVRDPVDTCLSCWRQLFVEGAETLYDLADIGREYAGYRGLMDHWASVLPGRVTPVSHEALVADPEAQIRWLVTEACGLPWTDACLRFYEAAGPVRTASYAQVRQPIFTTSLERWRRYERHLAPLFEALGPYAPTRSARTL